MGRHSGDPHGVCDRRQNNLGLECLSVGTICFGLTAKLGVRRRLEVVPDAETELLLGSVEEFELARFAVVVLEHQSERLIEDVPSQPAALERHVAAEVAILSHAAIESHEGYPVTIGWPGRRELRAELGLERFRAPLA